VSIGVFTRAREVRELEVEVAQLDLKAEHATVQQSEAENALVRAGEELDNLRNRHHTAALAVANHEKDLERSTERVKRIGEAQQTHVAERSDLLSEQESVGDDLIRLEEQLRSQRNDRESSQRAVDAVGLLISSAGRDLSRRESKVAEFRVAYRARDDQRLRLRETATRAAQSERETRSWIERREREIETARLRREELLTEIETAESELATQLVAEEVVRLESDQLRERFDATAELVAEVEENARDLRTGLGAAREKISRAELKLSEARMRLDHQASTVRDRWEIEIEHWKLPTLEELDAAGAKDNAGSDTNLDDHAAIVDEASPAPAEAVIAATDSREDAALEDEEPDLSPAAALRDAKQNIRLAMLPTAERQREADKVRKSLNSLGDVNLGAI
jgi:chromosome segregation ATPase